jgi:hypothetical protein
MGKRKTFTVEQIHMNLRYGADRIRNMEAALQHGTATQFLGLPITCSSDTQLAVFSVQSTCTKTSHGINSGVCQRTLLSTLLSGRLGSSHYSLAATKPPGFSPTA